MLCIFYNGFASFHKELSILRFHSRFSQIDKMHDLSALSLSLLVMLSAFFPTLKAPFLQSQQTL